MDVEVVHQSRTWETVDDVYVMMQRMPAPLAAASPMVLSSITTQAFGSRPKRSAAKA